MTVLTLNYPCSQCLLDNGDMIKAEKTEKRALSVDEFTLKLELFVEYLKRTIISTLIISYYNP